MKTQQNDYKVLSPWVLLAAIVVLFILPGTLWMLEFFNP